MSVHDLPPPFASATGRVDPRQWDCLAGDHLYASARWLSFCRRDREGLTGGLHVGGAESPRAAVAVTALKDEKNPFYQWSETLSGRGIRPPRRAGLMVGQRRGYQTHLLRSPGTSREDAAAELLSEVRSLAGDESLRAALGQREAPACVGMFLHTPDVRALRAVGVTTPPVLLQLDAWIPVPADWDNYLAILSKSRAGMVKRDRVRFANSGLRVVRSPLGDCVDEAGRLLASTESRYGSEASSELHVRSFVEQAEDMGEDAEVLLAEDDEGHAVGFSLFYHVGDTLYLRAAGFDYSKAHRAGVYFTLVYYAPMEIAIERGVRWIHAGIEAAEAKALRGAELRPLWMLDLSEDSLLREQADLVDGTNAALVRRLSESSKPVQQALTEDVPGVPE